MRLLLAFLLCTLSAANFSGSYVGSQDGVEFKLELKQEGPKVTGQARGAGITFNLSGSVIDDTAEGTMLLEGTEEKMFFRATLKGEGLEMKIADADENGKASWAGADTIAFKRTSPAESPSEKPAAGKLIKFTKAPTAMLKGGKEYTHASGGKFRYPASWSLKEEEAALVLTPPDANNEHFFIVGEKAEGATDPSSPEVVSYLDETVRSLLPSMKRVGAVEKASAGAGKGAFLIWEGDHEGRPSQVRAYVTILMGYGISLVAFGPKESISKRDGALREMFYTFGWGQGKRDDKLVGTWKHWSYKATSGVESKATAVLAADGTFSYESDSESSGNVNIKNQYGDQTAWGVMYSRNGSGWKGTWAADGSELTLFFEDGSSESFDYEFKQEGANVFLVTYGADRKKPMEWSRG
jgi:hypothetical protein